MLISYCDGMARLIDEGICLRNENAELVMRLQREKGEADAGARRRPGQRAWPNPPSSPISPMNCARR